MLNKINKQRMEGFTLIELLIVMAVLGVLAVVVLIAINPAEQLARARDSGKISGVQQLGRAVTAYYVGNGAMPNEDATWITQMVNTQDLGSVPADPAPNFPVGGAACTGGRNQQDWCYDTATSGTQEHAAVWTDLEAQQYTSACGGAGASAYAVFSTYDARGGWGCAEPTAGATYTFQ
ncbi:prepilin-type N-terminal cleavage/methylation domain-containing protein [Candidatus Woesebacteria bacterium]|nr:prepilin-type N-terminal cleavage/methylation domain-containing protein [Candidatus Woesebacteria bacterium]